MSLLLALLLLQATPEQKEVARRLFAEGEIAYNRGEYPLAEAKFRAAAQADPDLPGPARMLGLTLRAEKSCKEAIAWFQKYLKLQPQGKWSPAVKQQVELCRKELGLPALGNLQPQQGTGILVVVTNLDGAIIKVDDLQRGVTPVEPLQVAPGRHAVLIYKQCYVPRTESVDIYEGQVADIKVELLHDPSAPADCEAPHGPRIAGDRGRVRLLTDAPGLTVAVDGKATPMGPDTSFEAAPGIHMVSASAPGFEVWERRVVVMRGQERSLEVRLRTQNELKSLRRWAWTALGVAAAAGAVGIIYGIQESHDYADARRLADDERNRTGADPPVVTRAQLDDLQASAHNKAVVADLALGVAAAALGASVVLFVLER